MSISRSYFVTGTGSGIGRALAEHLLDAGHTVYGGVLNADEGAHLSQAMQSRQFGTRFYPIAIDVRSEESAQQSAANVAGLLQGNPLAGLANVAGIIANGPLMDLDAQKFQNILAVNVVGMHNVTRAFLPLLQSAGRSNVVNMSSASGTRTMPFAAAYSASKFAVEALSTGMRLELAPLGIAVSVVAPGLINTPMAQQIVSELRQPATNPAYTQPLQRLLSGTLNASEHGIPMARVVSVIANALTSARPAARYEIHHNYLRDAVLLRALPLALRDRIIRRKLGLHAQTQ